MLIAWSLPLGLVSNLWCGARCESSGGLIMIGASPPQMTVGDKRRKGMKVGNWALMYHGGPATWETRQGLRITFVRGLR